MVAVPMTCISGQVAATLSEETKALCRSRLPYKLYCTAHCSSSKGVKLDSYAYLARKYRNYICVRGRNRKCSCEALVNALKNSRPTTIRYKHFMKHRHNLQLAKHLAQMAKASCGGSTVTVLEQEADELERFSDALEVFE
eukprot:gene8678-625_t